MQAQLFFLLQRAQQMQDLRQADLFEPVRVADFLVAKDRLFARLNLDREEFTLYEQVYSHLTIDVPRPDLVIYLQAPVDVLLSVSASAVSVMNAAWIRAICAHCAIPTRVFSIIMTNHPC